MSSLDYNFGRKDDPLGDVSVRLDELLDGRTIDFSERLVSSQGSSTVQGSLLFSVNFRALAEGMSEAGVLRVHLSHATDLKSADSNGFSDPYATLPPLAPPLPPPTPILSPHLPPT